MSETIFLDPEKVTELEPVDEEPRKRRTLSPFAVPTSADMITDAARHLVAIRFNYLGGETGEDVTVLDAESDPAVTVLAARHTHKILELRFDPPIERPTPISVAQLVRIAERLETCSARIPTGAGRLSYVLIARIIEKWADFFMQRIANNHGAR